MAGNPGNPNPSPATRFKPGQVANPNGRPKKRDCISDVLRELLESAELRGKPLPDGKTAAELLAEELLIGALGTKNLPAGKVSLIQLILDRTEGKAVQRVIADVTRSTRAVVVEDNGRPTREPLGNGNGRVATAGSTGTATGLSEE